MTTIWTHAFDSDNSGDTNFTYRVVIPITGDAEGQVRVTFYASLASGGLGVDNASVGIATGTEANTTATPVELLFSGVSGFTIAQGASAVSDWLNFAGFTSANSLVVVLDMGPTSAGFRYANATTANTYWHSAANSYNSATTPAGSTLEAGQIAIIGLIETQAGGPEPPAAGPSEDCLIGIQLSGGKRGM